MADGTPVIYGNLPHYLHVIYIGVNKFEFFTQPYCSVAHNTSVTGTVMVLVT